MASKTGNLAQVVLAVGVIYLAYKILKDWRIISASRTTKTLALSSSLQSSPSSPAIEWTPLSDEQLHYIESIVRK